MRRTALTLLTVSMLSLGCSTQLKIPLAAKAGQELKITGYKQKFMRSEDAFSIGAYRVSKIDRDWSDGTGGSETKFGHSAKNTEFRYQIEAQGRTLIAECVEDVVVNTLFGASEQKLKYECTCVEGGAQRATLGFDGQSGTVHVGQSKYELTSLVRTESGLEVFPPPGYQFRNAQATGVVDKPGSRVFLPQALSEDDALGLVCSYTGVFLYRPTSR